MEEIQNKTKKIISIVMLAITILCMYSFISKVNAAVVEHETKEMIVGESTTINPGMVTTYGYIKEITYIIGNNNIIDVKLNKNAKSKIKGKYNKLICTAKKSGKVKVRIKYYDRSPLKLKGIKTKEYLIISKNVTANTSENKIKKEKTEEALKSIRARVLKKYNLK